MQDGKGYLKWCLKQAKGIRIVKPSDNLHKAYLRKARSAIKSMEVNAGVGITEWAVSASYYSKYFAVYALLQKIGVKCEIHDCTIELFDYLFHDSIPKQLIQELRRSKDDRIEAQYYTQEIKVDLEQLVNKTKNFVLETEKIIDALNSERIEQLQKKLKELVSSSKKM
jgi:uncharacterized protein (UPF0332 family)